MPDMLTLLGSFAFDGKDVYSEFLNKAFRFSRDLQQTRKAQTRKAEIDTSTFTKASDAAAFSLQTVAQQPVAAPTVTSTASKEEVGKRSM